MSTERRVYIVDDNAEFRDSACFWLEGAGYGVQAWGDPTEAVDALQRLHDAPQDTEACVLLDLRMPGLSGLDAHDALRERGVRWPVIYMSGHADVPLAVQAMRKGAINVLEKPLDGEQLDAALERAFASPGSDAGASAVAETPDAQTLEFLRRERSLAPREREVLGLVIQGIYNKVIADRMGLSIKTIELYRARGMAKMKTRSAADLTRMMVSRRA